jgi:light-regulated signal transduction histidine kinase (bacteriophytochrome)
LIEENRRIFEGIKEKELEALRARAAGEAAEVRAMMADQLASANLRLERANQELEQFAYAAAHDLQEPLRQIHIFSELLQSRIKGTLDPETQEYLDLSIQGTARMGELITDLLLYAGAIKLTERPQTALDLHHALEKSLLNLDVMIKESGAVVVCRPLPSLFVDDIRFQQLFQNLIGNAIKYSRPGTPPRIEVSAEREGSMWIFSVADNGMGIAEQHSGRVFEAFKRLDPASHSGTGLGLAICKRIVDQLGGSISVQSEIGQGSTFKFTIPVALTAPEHPQAST